jgi:hypothetical protein
MSPAMLLPQTDDGRRDKPSPRHSGARPQAENPQSITIGTTVTDSGLAFASLRRPGMTGVSKLDASTPSGVPKAGLEGRPAKSLLLFGQFFDMAATMR